MAYFALRKFVLECMAFFADHVLLSPEWMTVGVSMGALAGQLPSSLSLGSFLTISLKATKSYQAWFLVRELDPTCHVMRPIIIDPLQCSCFIHSLFCHRLSKFSHVEGHCKQHDWDYKETEPLTSGSLRLPGETSRSKPFTVRVKHTSLAPHCPGSVPASPSVSSVTLGSLIKCPYATVSLSINIIGDKSTLLIGYMRLIQICKALKI